MQKKKKKTRELNFNFILRTLIIKITSFHYKLPGGLILDYPILGGKDIPDNVGGCIIPIPIPING